MSVSRLAAAVVLAATLAACASEPPPPAADLLLVNAKVYSMTWPDPAPDGTPAALNATASQLRQMAIVPTVSLGQCAPHDANGWRPDATAIAITGGRITLVGTRGDDEHEGAGHEHAGAQAARAQPPGQHHERANRDAVQRHEGGRERQSRGIAHHRHDVARRARPAEERLG